MSRTKIDIPSVFSFSTLIPVRITDINYGGHAGNDTFLSLIHEARMQFLNQLGYTEMDFGGIGLIMRNVSIEFKHELFYGDIVTISVATGGFSTASFDIYYKLEKHVNSRPVPVAFAVTGMAGYDYSHKKIAALPQVATEKLQSANY